MIRSSLQRQPTYHSILTTRRHQSSSPLNPISADPIPTSYDSIKPPKGIHLSTSSSPSPALSSRVKFDHHRKILQARLDPHLLTAQTHINHYLKSSRKNLNDRLKALEWEKRLGEVGGRINDATGYGEIERLRKGVVERERLLLKVRESAGVEKKRYSDAVIKRSKSQREVNDLLGRKSSWSSADVIRFTELVREDHDNEREELRSKIEIDLSEESVEKGFSDLMQAILERYHEEQVWSDKIRSLSTYGSLAITSLNVFLFIVTILLVEPWKRKRLVEGVESRLRLSTNQTNQATVSSITALQSLLTDAQSKLDQLLIAPLVPSPIPLPILVPTDQSVEEEEEITEKDVEEVARAIETKRQERENELLMVGVGSAIAGIIVSCMIGLLRF